MTSTPKGAVPPASMPAKVAMLFAGRLAAFAFAFLTPIVLVRVFTPAEFGLYKQLFLVHATVTSMLTLGLPASLFFFVPRDPEDRPVYLSQTFFALLGMGFISAAMLVGLKAQVSRGINNADAEAYLPYLAGLVLLSLATCALETTMVVTNDVKLAAVTTLASEICRSVVIIAAAVLTGSVLALFVAASVWGLARLGALIAYLRAIGGLRWLRTRDFRLGRQLRYSTPLGGARALKTLADTLPQYVVSFTSSPALFAIYSVGALQVPFVSLAAESVSDVTLVRLTQLCKSGNLRGALGLIHQAVAKLALLFFPLCALLLVISPQLIVALYTDKFASSIPVFQVFLLSIPLAAFGLDQVPRALDDTAFLLRVSALRVLVSALLLAALVGPFGLVGAALATVVSLGLVKACTAWRVARLLQVGLPQALPWSPLARIATASLLSGLSAAAVQAAGGLDDLSRVALGIGVFLACYGLLIWSWDLVSRDDVRKVLSTADLLLGGERR